MGGSLWRTVKKLKTMSADTFGKLCPCGPFTAKFRLVHDMSKEIGTLGALSALDSSESDQVNVQIKQAFNKPLRMRRTRVVGAAILIERN